MSDLKKAFSDLQKGKMKAFDKIYIETYKTVYMTSYLILKNEDSAKDIMQNVYMQLLDKIKTMDVFDYPKAWLVRVARNLSLNEYNHHKRQINIDVMDANNQSVFGSTEISDNPTITLAQKILSEDEYTILVLCAIDEYKRKEVANLLDMPIGTVTWKYNEAIKKMQLALEEKEEIK